MKRETKVEKNYKIMIAGRERIIPYIILVKSRFDGGFNIQDNEFRRISFIVSKEICFSKEVLNLEELEFLRNTFKLNQYEVAEVLGVTNSALSKWKISKKENGLNITESFLLKNFFKEKLIKETEKIGQNKLLLEIIIYEIKGNLIQKDKIDMDSIKNIEKIIIDNLISSEFDINMPSRWTEKIIKNSQKYDFEPSDYKISDKKEDIDYSEEYLETLKITG